MGISPSSLLDETKANYIKGETEAELRSFSPCYRKQFSVAYFSQLQDQLQQHQEQTTQLLKQRGAPQEGEVLYEEGVLFFDETRKWRERYVVVRANYCLECHDGLETFVKGVPPRQKLLPTGGTVLTTEEKYMAMVDKCFPDDANTGLGSDPIGTVSPLSRFRLIQPPTLAALGSAVNGVKEDFAPPLNGMPGQFPVYLRLPYRRDSFFCFRQEAKQAGFLSILSDCIRHQNQDFLKKKTCEVQAFLKAVQLYRQEKGRYEAWDMLIGSDVRVMANLVMEQLLPSLEKDMLPRLKVKKTERKRVWFATVEEAYILVQERLLEGLSALKEECRTAARQQEVLIHSDMDQINGSRALLESKMKASVSEPAERFCAESIQPYLASVLEEMMEPISSGFQEARQLSDSMMDQICQDYQAGGTSEDLKQALSKLSRPNLLTCYQRISSLQEQLHHLQERFGFSNITSLIHSAQIDLQQLVENAATTFEQLLNKAIQDHPDNAGSAMEKVKLRVLKQYDYDSSTVRKRIFQDGLVAITLPHIKKNLAATCKSSLQDLDQFIYADHSNFVNVENVYEGILLQTLDKEVTRVVKEAANHRKHNLFTDSRDLLSQSSRSSLSSTPGSPAQPGCSARGSPHRDSPHLASPLVANGLPAPAPPEEMTPLRAVTEEPPRETTEEVDLPLAQAEAVAAAIVAAVIAEKVEEMEAAGVAAARQEEEEEEEEEVVQSEVFEAAAESTTPVPTGTPKEDVPALPEAAGPAETEEVRAPAAPETVVTVTVETSVEPETQNAASPETPSAVASVEVEVDAPEAAAAAVPDPTPPATPVPGPGPIPEHVVQQTPVDAVAERMAPLTVTTTEEGPASVTTVITTEEESVGVTTVITTVINTEEEPVTVTMVITTEEEPTSVTTVITTEEEPMSVTTVINTEEEPVSATTLNTTKEEPTSATTVNTTTEGPVSVTTVITTDRYVTSVPECKSGAGAESEAPSGGAEPVTAPPDGAPLGRVATLDDPSSLNVSVGTDSCPSDPESFEGSRDYPSSEDDRSATSIHSEDDDVRASESPVSSDEDPAAEVATAGTSPVVSPSEDVVLPQAPTEDPGAGEEVTAGADVESEPSESPTKAPEVASGDTQASASPEPAAMEAAQAVEAPSPVPGPVDCIQAIRNLVVEVIEVEELALRYPCGVPKADEY